jgi:hypothetical protein
MPLGKEIDRRDDLSSSIEHLPDIVGYIDNPDGQPRIIHFERFFFGGLVMRTLFLDIGGAGKVSAMTSC